MSIIPEIPRPTIAPNRNSETRYTQSLHVTADEYIYGVGIVIKKSLLKYLHNVIPFSDSCSCVFLPNK